MRGRVKARPYDTIVLGGATAGVLDLLDACVVTWMSGGSALRMLQFIASGVLGAASYTAGRTSAGLGLALHFVIAFAAAAVFLAISRLVPAVLRAPLVMGVVFGIGVFLVMNLIILPAAGFAGGLPAGWRLANGLLIHALGVGVPIAWFASRSARVR